MKTFVLIMVFGWSLTALAQAPSNLNTRSELRLNSRLTSTAGSECMLRRLPHISNEATQYMVTGGAYFRMQAYDKAIGQWTRAYLLHPEVFPEPLYNIAAARFQIAQLTWDRKQRLVEEQKAQYAFQNFLEISKDPIYQQRPEMVKWRSRAEQVIALLDQEIDRLETALRAEDKADHDRGVYTCQVMTCASPGDLTCGCPSPSRPRAAR